MVKAIKAAQLADQIRDYLATWASQDFPGALFAITQVTLTPDLRQATIWVDVLIPDSEKKIIAELNKKRNSYRHKLAQTFQRRSVPILTFSLDDHESIALQLDALLKL